MDAFLPTSTSPLDFLKLKRSKLPFKAKIKRRSSVIKRSLFFHDPSNLDCMCANKLMRKNLQ
jgi:hypothetical protein